MADRNPVLCIPKHLTEDISDGRHWRLVKWEIVPVTVSMAEQLELVELTTRDTDSETENLRETASAAVESLRELIDDNGVAPDRQERIRNVMLLLGAESTAPNPVQGGPS